MTNMVVCVCCVFRNLTFSGWAQQQKTVCSKFTSLMCHTCSQKCVNVTFSLDFQTDTSQLSPLFRVSMASQKSPYLSHEGGDMCVVCGVPVPPAGSPGFSSQIHPFFQCILFRISTLQTWLPRSPVPHSSVCHASGATSMFCLFSHTGSPPVPHADEQ